MPEREPTSVVDYLNLAADFFAKREIENPRLHAELLLGDVVGLKRIELYLQFDRPLTSPEVQCYREYLRRRSTGEPVQYILGHTEFFGRTFAVNSSVLIPRPETEVLVEQTLDRMKGVANPHVLDIGTGSGAIAVTIAAERDDACIVATDISTAALDTARANAECLGVSDRVEFVEGDLFEAVSGRLFDAIVSNPPYVAENDRKALQREVRDHEPATALFAGTDGLDTIRRIVQEAPQFIHQTGFCALEIGMGQHEAVCALWRDVAPDWRVSVVKDLAEIERVAIASREHGR